jgi:hypothetical protein
MSYTLHKGEIPEGMQVLHRCDNPRCVNPSHLFLGTNQDNNDDKMQKGRHGHGAGGETKGSMSIWAKITEADAHAIRKEYRPFRVTRRMIAEKYGLCKSSIDMILSGKTWAHVPIPAQEQREIHETDISLFDHGAR